MCGICGIISSDNSYPVQKNLLGAMCDVITHRGPDEEGYYIDGGIGLGMRRLKIIDLSTGSQPIFNEDKSVVVVFNGEIYNFLELRNSLIQKGHTFFSSSDTEVIVHLYEDHGDKFLDHLNGMFGIALWDIKRRKLILARDRMGEKPLYFTKKDDVLIFGSELKSVLCFPNLGREINNEAIYHYFSFNYIPTPLTIYKNINKLAPGECLTFKDNKITINKYWSLSSAKQIEIKDEHEVAEELHKQLVNSIKMRLISDVPLGAFLSGGIDSSIMVALMSQISSTPVKTFSVGLENDQQSELPFARQVAKKYATDHHELIASPNAIDLIDQVLWHFDEPFGDSSALPTFLLSQLIRQHVTVAISGDGGDELFGGYERYQRILARTSTIKTPKYIRHLLSKTIGAGLPFGAKGKALLQSLQYCDYDFFTIGTSEELKGQLFSKDFLSSLGSITSKDIADLAFLPNHSLLQQCINFDIKYYLPDDILTKVDRMSMAASLETRAPFLDHNVVEFASSIPDNLKIKNNITKYILKNTFKDLLPEAIFTRSKSGFSIPLEDWFRKELKEMLQTNLSPKQLDETGVFAPHFVNTILDQHFSGKRNHKRLIWMILTFQLWHEQCYKRVHPKITAALNSRGIDG
jgi:asparagine synthase (glutamine-hydrolysing)